METRHRVRGFEVTVRNSRPDILTDDVIRSLDRAIGLIDEVTPHYGRHLRRDFSGFLVERYACRGAYFPDTRTCMVELTFCVNPAVTTPEISATILHEGMHARLHALGFPLEMTDRARQERFCRRAEIEFGQKVPGGRVVIDRALAALQMTDDEVAPHIDGRLAAQRILEVDRAALRRRTE
jgi:hypothetical protein